MEKSSQTTGIVVAVVALLLGLAGYWVLFSKFDTAPPVEPPPERIAAADTAHYLELRNVGLAEFENAGSKIAKLDHAGFDACFGKFRELAAKLPSERFGIQNLALASVWAAGDTSGYARENPSKKAAVRRQAAESLDALAKFPAAAGFAHAMRARLYIAESKEQQALEELRLASERLPHDAGLHYQTFSLLQNTYWEGRDEKAVKQQAGEALERAYEIAPDNLALLIDWLTRQAETHDVRIVETLNHAQTELAPFADDFVSPDGKGLAESLAAAVQAARNEKWGETLASVRKLKNIFLKLVARQRDQKRLQPHVLEYAMHDFSNAFYERADMGELAAPAPIRVAFQRLAETEQPQPAQPVRAALMLDFTLDGKQDLAMLQDDRVQVFSRDQDNGWSIVAESVQQGDFTGLRAIDLDRDYRENQNNAANAPATNAAGTNATGKTPPNACLAADLDLVLFGQDGILILENKRTTSGKRELNRVDLSEEMQALHDVFTVETADFDHDGDLDLLVSSAEGVSLWSNRENFTFRDASRRTKLPPPPARITKIIPVDVNRNVDLDFIMASSLSGAAGVLESQLRGRFRWREDLPLEELADIAVADVDGNASWDLLALRKKDHAVLVVKTTTGASGVQYGEVEKVGVARGEHLQLFDFDNDGYQDVLVWGETGCSLFRGEPRGGFSEQTEMAAGFPEKVVGCDVADLDADGDLDLLFVSDGGVTLWENDGGNANHWLDLQLVAESHAQNASERTNTYGIGGLIEIKAGRRYQAATVSRIATHFGLGKLEHADTARIVWTNGIPQNMIAPQQNETVCAEQDLMGSCPYLYTWDGEKFAFFSDCLWASPLGLWQAEGKLAPYREWEYLRIPGDALKPRQGEYQIQVTEELWEAAYFDSMQLIAIDHPQDVEIYSNEKVGPPDIAEHRIFTVREQRPPVAARDQNGRDVLALVLKEDGEFLRGYDARIKQGLAPEHFLELDFGDLSSDERVHLYLTGWIWPTDASLNLAISENPKLASPRPPSLSVPDENGQWREVLPYLGFPGGKTKTIVTDLSGLFLTDDYRVRISTTMQIYWDAAFISANEPAAEYRTQVLELLGANLHYRGFSRRIAPIGEGPVRYDYAHVDVAQRWPPMLGQFTRYGDVADILNTADDRSVVLGAGDEMTVRFQQPKQPPPAGWKRTFLLYNIGWDKDANLSCLTGQMVEPLPFRAMQQYPFYDSDVLEEGGAFPRSEAMSSYLEQDQTRRQSWPRFWRQVLRGEPSGK